MYEGRDLIREAIVRNGLRPVRRLLAQTPGKLRYRRKFSANYAHNQPRKHRKEQQQGEPAIDEALPFQVAFLIEQMRAAIFVKT